MNGTMVEEIQAFGAFESAVHYIRSNLLLSGILAITLHFSVSWYSGKWARVRTRWVKLILGTYPQSLHVRLELVRPSPRPPSFEQATQTGRRKGIQNGNSRRKLCL